MCKIIKEYSNKVIYNKLQINQWEYQHNNNNNRSFNMDINKMKYAKIH